MVVRNVVRSPVRAVVQSVFGEGESFHPFQLFTSGAQGAWYDPSDFSTLFQNNAGNVPVTAVEQPVRLMLDKSKGLVLGSELVPSAPSVSAFNANGTAVVAGNVITCTCTTNGTYGFSITSVAPAINKSYRLVVTTVTNSASRLLFADFGGLTRSFGSLAGTAERIYTATTSTGSLVVYILGGVAGETFSVNLATLSVRELPGNHAVAPNDASRPVLRARYNLLTYSEQFDNAAWVKVNATVTANAGVAPDGTTTADKLVEDNANSTHVVLPSPFVPVINGATYVLSVYAKAVERSRIYLRDNGTTSVGAYFDLSNGTAYSPDANVISTSVTDAGNGWYRCSVRYATGTTAANTQVRLVSTGTTQSYTGDGTSGILIWGASLLTAADHAATGGAYQRIGAATDYDTGPPWRPYLAFDGSDDSMSTSSIDFSGTDEMTVFAGLTKLSDAAIATVCMLGASASDGYFVLQAPSVDGSPRFQFFAKGTAEANVVVNNAIYAAPNTRVVTITADISAPQVAMRIDGASVNTSTATMGTGNFANAALFIGRRNNSSLPFNGRLYGLTVLGRTATASELTAMESWIAGKTGVTI